MNNFIEKVKAYYPQYLLAHQNKWNRRLHLVGNTVTLGWVIASLIILTFVSFFYGLGMLAIAPFIIYLFAWPGHLIFEKNKPATWNVSPLMTKACDWLMVFDMLNGRIEL